MNKCMKNIAALFVGAMAAFSMTSCLSNDSEDSGYPILFQFTFADSSYGSNDVWNKVYDTTQGAFDVATLLKFSHSASAYEYDGVKYSSWYGFCPSKVSDIADYTEEGWTNHQWAAYTTEIDTTNPGYIVGFWDVREDTKNYVSNPSCYIDLVKPASPVAMTIGNTTWSYFALKNGTAFNKAFTTEDTFKLIVKGVRSGAVTGTVTLNLAAKGWILDQWVSVSLLSLGEVDRIYFQMESTDSGAYGMNNPAFFAIKNMIFNYETYPLTSNTSGASFAY